MIVTVTINPTLDIIAPVDTLLPGKVLRSKSIRSNPAGKGTNTARAFAALGAGAVAAGFCGKNDTAAMSSFLKKYRVKADFISVPGANRLCLLIPGKNNETVINSESGLKINAGHCAKLLKKLRTLSKTSSVFVFSGSLPLSVPASFYASCIRTVKNNSTIILDTSGKSLREGIKAGPQILKVNLHELESAFGVRLKSLVETGFKPVSTAGKFISGLSAKYGIKTIIVTLGSKGSVLFGSGVFNRIKPVKVKCTVSPVGCGDAYSAGLAYGIEKGLGMADCCRLASAFAAANLKHMGACFISKREVLDVLPAGFHCKNLL